MPTKFSPDRQRKTHAREAAVAAPETVPPDGLAGPLRWVRRAVAIMWIATGVVSLGLYPVAQSYALLARAGVPQTLAPLALYGAGVLDIALGVACLMPLGYRYRRCIWLAQASLVLFYTLIISLRLPEFWLHPYGPILKNLPLLAILWLLYKVEPIATPNRNGS